MKPERANRLGGGGEAKAPSRLPPDRLGRKEHAIAGLMRILSAEIEGSRAALLNCAPDQADTTIHRVRRRLKKARTVTRLLRPVFGERAAVLMVELKLAGKALSGARDAAVLAVTAADVATAIDDELAFRLLAGVAARAKVTAAKSAVGADMRDAALEHLANAAAELATPRLVGADESAVFGRAANLYRRARRGWRAAESRPGTEALHDWRKFVKDRLHLVRLFRERWPEGGRPPERQLDQLGELLGRDHDLAVLAERLPERLEAASPLFDVIGARRRALTRKAFSLAKDLFAMKPRDVRAAWRRG